jgi:hypothetical protein
MSMQTIHIDFPGEPFNGAVFKREMSYGGGYFQITIRRGV